MGRLPYLGRRAPWSSGLLSFSAIFLFAQTFFTQKTCLTQKMFLIRFFFLPKAYPAETFLNQAYSVKCASSELLRACCNISQPQKRFHKTSLIDMATSNVSNVSPIISSLATQQRKKNISYILNCPFLLPKKSHCFSRDSSSPSWTFIGLAFWFPTKGRMNRWSCSKRSSRTYIYPY